MLQVKPRGDTEVNDFDTSFLEVDQDIERADVFVDDVVLVDFSEGIGSTNSHVEKIEDIVLFLLEDFLEGPGFEPIQEEGVAVFLLRSLEDIAGPFEVKAFNDIVFIVKLGDIIGRGEFEVEDLHDHGTVPLVVIHAVNFGFLAFVNELFSHKGDRYRLFFL
jgi:hypothetical protein